MCISNLARRHPYRTLHERVLGNPVVLGDTFGVVLVKATLESRDPSIAVARVGDSTQ